MNNVVSINSRKKSYLQAPETNSPINVMHLMNAAVPGDTAYFCVSCHSPVFGCLKKDDVQMMICLSCGEASASLEGFELLDEEPQEPVPDF